MTIEVPNPSQASITTYGEQKSFGINKQKALRGRAITLIDDTSDTEEGTVSNTSPATLEVDIDKAQGTYSIRAGATIPMKLSQKHVVSCTKDKCRTENYSFGMEGCLQSGIGGKLEDLNRLQGSESHVTTGLGRGRNGTFTTTMTWNLARSGTNK